MSRESLPSTTETMSGLLSDPQAMRHLEVIGTDPETNRDWSEYLNSRPRSIDDNDQYHGGEHGGQFTAGYDSRRTQYEKATNKAYESMTFIELRQIAREAVTHKDESTFSELLPALDRRIENMKQIAADRGQPLSEREVSEIYDSVFETPEAESTEATDENIATGAVSDERDGLTDKDNTGSLESSANPGNTHEDLAVKPDRKISEVQETTPPVAVEGAIVEPEPDKFAEKLRVLDQKRLIELATEYVQRDLGKAVYGIIGEFERRLQSYISNNGWTAERATSALQEFFLTIGLKKADFLLHEGSKETIDPKFGKKLKDVDINGLASLGGDYVRRGWLGAVYAIMAEYDKRLAVFARQNNWSRQKVVTTRHDFFVATGLTDNESQKVPQNLMVPVWRDLMEPLWRATKERSLTTAEKLKRKTKRIQTLGAAGLLATRTTVHQNLNSWKNHEKSPATSVGSSER